jgi:threonine/homoserine/homoserine lactone efflux protein
VQLEIIGMGILLGIAFAAPPGAVTAETLRRGARGGFALAFGVQLGSLIGDAAYAMLALAGLAALAEIPALQITLGALGAMFLMYLAWSSFQTARAPMALTISNARVETRGAFFSGMLLSLTNPWAIAFWLSLGGALASLGIAGASAQHIAALFLSFMLGSAVWAFALAFAIARARHWLKPAIFRALSMACGVALGAFAITAALRVVSTFAIL